MDKFTRHSGTAVSLQRANIDTDQVLPARYCLTTKRTGFADRLFARWREDPSFPLVEPARAGATVLVTGPNFGSGSSREHAVWALQDWGFKVVIAPSFGDIFYANCGHSGLLPVRLHPEEVDALASAAESPDAVVTVDLLARTVSWPGGDAPMDIDEEMRERFLSGMDDIDLTLNHENEIRAYENRYRFAWRS